MMKLYHTGSIASKLSVMFAVAGAVMIFALFFAMEHIEDKELELYQTAEIKNRFTMIEPAVAEKNSPQYWHDIQHRIADITRETKGRILIRIDSSDPNYRIEAPFNIEAEKIDSEGKISTPLIDGRDFIVYSRRIPANGLRPDIVLSLAVDTYYYDDLDDWFDYAVTAFLILCISLTAFIGHKIAARCLQPVDRLSHSAQTLSPGNLAARLPDKELPDELQGLVSSFNGALERLEEAHKRQAAFNSDVAHELRTPLGNLIGETEVALSRQRSSEELENVLQSNLEELERLRSIINDMLFLSHADQGEIAINLKKSSIAEVVSQTADFLEVIFEENGNKLRIDGNAEALIEPSLIKRALTNLLNNAVEHGCPEKPVTVKITDLNDSVEVRVVNFGEHITDEQLLRLFDRFYRVSSERRNSSANHGLGLAIVKAIIDMHGGRVFAFSNDDRIEIGFTLPK